MGFDLTLIVGLRTIGILIEYCKKASSYFYKTTNYWYPEHERSLLWCDPTVGIQWPVDGAPKLAAKDVAGKVLAEADAFA